MTKKHLRLGSEPDALEKYLASCENEPNHFLQRARTAAARFKQGASKACAQDGDSTGKAEHSDIGGGPNTGQLPLKLDATPLASIMPLQSVAEDSPSLLPHTLRRCQSAPVEGSDSLASWAPSEDGAMQLAQLNQAMRKTDSEPVKSAVEAPRKAEGVACNLLGGEAHHKHVTSVAWNLDIVPTTFSGEPLPETTRQTSFEIADASSELDDAIEEFTAYPSFVSEDTQKKMSSERRSSRSVSLSRLESNAALKKNPGLMKRITSKMGHLRGKQLFKTRETDDMQNEEYKDFAAHDGDCGTHRRWRILSHSSAAQLRDVVESTWFSLIAIGIVILHSIFFAVETNYDFGMGPSSAPFIVDLCMTCIYILEQALRFLVDEHAYFTNRWNILDLVLIFISVIDLIIVLATLSSSSLSVMATFRMARLLRIARLLRLLRFFKSLWLLVCGLASSTRTVFWAWVFMSLLIYIFGLCLARILAPHYCKFTDDSTDEELHNLDLYFGGVWRSMFSVFQTITMEDWIALADSAAEYEPATRVIFFIVLGTCTWGVMHVITAVFVQSALEASNVRSIDIAKKAKEKYQESCKFMCEIFQKADEDHNGSLSKEEYMHSLESPEVIEKLGVVGIDKNSAQELFDMLDLQGAKQLSSAEFVEGVLRSCGPAKNKDVLSLRCDIWRVDVRLQDEFDRASKYIESRLEQTMRRVEALQKKATPILRRAAALLKQAEVSSLLNGKSTNLNAHSPQSIVNGSTTRQMTDRHAADTCNSGASTTVSDRRPSLSSSDDSIGMSPTLPQEVPTPVGTVSSTFSGSNASLVEQHPRSKARSLTTPGSVQTNPPVLMKEESGRSIYSISPPKQTTEGFAITPHQSPKSAADGPKEEDAVVEDISWGSLARTLK